jgi:hypothetical protein
MINCLLQLIGFQHRPEVISTALRSRSQVPTDPHHTKATDTLIAALEREERLMAEKEKKYMGQIQILGEQLKLEQEKNLSLAAHKVTLEKQVE